MSTARSTQKVGDRPAAKRRRVDHPVRPVLQLTARATSEYERDLKQEVALVLALLASPASSAGGESGGGDGSGGESGGDGSGRVSSVSRGASPAPASRRKAGKRKATSGSRSPTPMTVLRPSTPDKADREPTFKPSVPTPRDAGAAGMTDEDAEERNDHPEYTDFVLEMGTKARNEFARKANLCPTVR